MRIAALAAVRVVGASRPRSCGLVPSRPARRCRPRAPSTCTSRRTAPSPRPRSRPRRTPASGAPAMSARIFVVDQPLHRRQLLRRRRRDVREVEAQPVRRDQRARLPHVRRRAPGAAPRAAGASPCGCARVARRCAIVDARRHRVADRDARRSRRSRECTISRPPPAYCVSSTTTRPCGPTISPRVADLAAALRVERRLGQHDLDALARRRRAPARRAAPMMPATVVSCSRAVVPDELRPHVLRAAAYASTRSASYSNFAAARPRSRCAASSRSNPPCRHVEARLPRDLPRQLERIAEGVVQPERLAARKLRQSARRRPVRIDTRCTRPRSSVSRNFDSSAESSRFTKSPRSTRSGTRTASSRSPLSATLSSIVSSGAFRKLLSGSTPRAARCAAARSRALRSMASPRR